MQHLDGNTYERAYDFSNDLWGRVIFIVDFNCCVISFPDKMISSMEKKIDWNKDATMQLIDLWEQYPCLYDVKSRLYTNKFARYDALTKMADGLKSFYPNITHEDVKTKVNNLRSQYNHELNKQRSSVKNAAGTDELYQSSAYWFNKLKFLKTFIKARKGKSSLEIVNENVSNRTNFGEMFVRIQYPEMIDDGTLLTPPVKRIHMEESLSSSNPKRNSKKQCDEEDLVLQTSNAIKCLTSSIEKHEQYEKNVDAFGEYVKAELDVIKDQNLRDEIKYQIHNIIFEGKKKQRDLDLCIS